MISCVQLIWIDREESISSTAPAEAFRRDHLLESFGHGRHPGEHRDQSRHMVQCSNHGTLSVIEIGHYIHVVKVGRPKRSWRVPSRSGISILIVFH